MVRRGLFVLLGAVVAAVCSTRGSVRMAAEPSARGPAITEPVVSVRTASGRAAPGGPAVRGLAASGRAVRGLPAAQRQAAGCRGFGRGEWFSAAARRTARTGARDRATLGRDEAAGLVADLHRRLMARFGASDDGVLAGRLPDKIVVPVLFHVISSGELGRLPDSVVQDQIATLNAAYGGATGGADTGVSFRLDGSDYTDNAEWFAHPQQSEKAMKAALRRGGQGTLNLYTAAVGTDTLGFSTFPQWYAGHPVLDGVVVDYRTLPGSEFPHFDKGYTAVHEVGHWLGLFHTFENGCNPPGDWVDDTPYEAIPTRGCPLFKDTCPAPGADPIHNFMDYGYDECMTEFTAGQGRRIHSVWAAYRGATAKSVSKPGPARSQ